MKEYQIKSKKLAIAVARNMSKFHKEVVHVWEDKVNPKLIVTLHHEFGIDFYYKGDFIKTFYKGKEQIIS